MSHTEVRDEQEIGIVRHAHAHSNEAAAVSRRDSNGRLAEERSDPLHEARFRGYICPSSDVLRKSMYSAGVARSVPLQRNLAHAYRPNCMYPSETAGYLRRSPAFRDRSDNRARGFGRGYRRRQGSKGCADRGRPRAGRHDATGAAEGVRRLWDEGPEREFLTFTANNRIPSRTAQRLTNWYTEMSIVSRDMPREWAIRETTRSSHLPKIIREKLIQFWTTDMLGRDTTDEGSEAS